jgi:hypothetical protein
MIKKYNKADRKVALAARRDAVLHLREKGYTFKAIGYSLGFTADRARDIYCQIIRIKTREMALRQKLDAVLPADVIAKFTVPKTVVKIESKHTA